MNIENLSKLINEKLDNNELETVIKFAVKLNKNANLKNELKKKFPKISDNDIQLVINIIKN